MKIVSFNVNSVRLRLHQLQALIEKHSPDIIGLQETKVQDKDFPLDAIQEMGYGADFFGQKTHYGVAMLSKLPCKKITLGFPGDDEDAQKRIIIGEYQIGGKGSRKSVTVINGYFPQGENRSHEVKFPAKQKFYADLADYLESEQKKTSRLVVMGDFNVAPVDNDIGIGADNAKRWLRTGATCFLPEEREWLQTLMDWGLVDTFREKYPDESDLFSWFDYRSRGFEREPKRGLRIDHLLATRSLAKTLVDSGIDYDVRAMEKPSDHCPVWSEFDI